MTIAKVAGGVALAVLLYGGVAQAQDYDPSARYDIDDILGRHPHNVSDLPTREEARGRPVTFELSLAGTYTTNAGADRTDPVDAVYATPAFGINITPVSVGGWDIGGGALIDADYYTGMTDEDYGEGRLEGFAFASRQIGPGVFTAEGILLGIFTDEFSHDFDLRIVDFTYAVGLAGLNTEFSAEYQDSDIRELKRWRLTAMAGHTWDTPVLGHEITLEGDLAFSDFNDGTNTNRNDTTAALVLIAERDLAPGLTIEWEAALVHRFSNREQSRFDAFDLGVTLAATF